MGVFSVTLPSGVEWVPEFVSAIDPDKCVGCGRCFKVCLRRVLELRGVDEDGEFVVDDDEYERMVMTIAHQDRCIGCKACAQVCAKKCYTHAPATV